MCLTIIDIHIIKYFSSRHILVLLFSAPDKGGLSVYYTPLYIG